MAEELLETQRAYHEQIDRLRKDAVTELATIAGRPVSHSDPNPGTRSLLQNQAP